MIDANVTQNTKQNMQQTKQNITGMMAKTDNDELVEDVLEVVP